MKKFLLLMVMALSVSASAVAEEKVYAVVDGINYRLEDADEYDTKNWAYVSHSETPYSGNIVIPSSITVNGKTYHVGDIESFAFYGCTDLVSVTLPTIYTDECCFAFCTGLKEVTMDGAYDIDNYCFYNCTALEKITIKSLPEYEEEGELPYARSNAFLGVPLDCKVVVPKGTKSFFTSPMYNPEGWLSFRNIEEQDFGGVSAPAQVRPKYFKIQNGEVTSLEDGLRVTVFGISGEILIDQILSNGEVLALPEGRISIVRANGQAVKVSR